jgi:hypothetical protein
MTHGDQYAYGYDPKNRLVEAPKTVAGGNANNCVQFRRVEERRINQGCGLSPHISWGFGVFW